MLLNRGPILLLLSCVSIAGCQSAAGGQLPIGVWVKTGPDGGGATLRVEPCCNGGRRLIYEMPEVLGQPATTVTFESPWDGTEVPGVAPGKPTGRTLAISPIDDRRFASVAKLNGAIVSTSTAVVSTDGKMLTVDAVTQFAGGASRKTIEVWERK